MSKYVICKNCSMILRYADGTPIADDDPDACNCGAPLDPNPPVVILELGGERYHFGDLTDMVLWLSDVVTETPDALCMAGMFWWASADMLPALGCVDYQEGDET